jgi:hypothetical protein
MNKRVVPAVVISILLLFSIVSYYIHQGKKPEAVTLTVEPPEDKAAQGELYTMRENGKYGYINREGFVIIKPAFEEGYSFCEGLARVSVRHKYGFIDKTGKVVIEPVFDEAGDFSQGMAMVSIDNKYGFIDREGKQAIPLEYDLVSSFSEGLAGAYARGKWGYINQKNERAIPPAYENAGSFRNGLAPVSHKGLYGYINQKGTFIIKPKYKLAYDFSEGLGEVALKNLYGFVDAKGNMGVQPVYEATKSYCEGLAAVQLKGKWGYIDKKGKLVIPAVYENAGSFSEGRAPVYDGKYWGYINRKGALVIDPQYTYVESFQKGLAPVRIDEVLSYVDTAGRLVWHEVEDIVIRGTEGASGRVIKMKKKSSQFDRVIKYPHVTDMYNKALQNNINKILESQSGIYYEGKEDETYRQDYDILLNQGGILSILTKSEMYVKGAAHGMSMRSSINLDAAEGKLYDLEDLFRAGVDYKSKLNRIIKKKLADDHAPLLREFDGIKERQAYYLTEKELVIYYQLYDYTPYAYGFLEFYIPYSSIRDMVNMQGPLGKILK